MEKEILELLRSIQTEMLDIKSDVKELKNEQKKLEKKLDGITEQTAALMEFKTSILK